MTDRILGLPAKYIQGQGALDRIGESALQLDNSALVFADGFVRDLVGARVTQSLEAAKVTCQWEDFNGECCRSEIDRLKAKGKNMNLVIAIGGGKALDTGKAVAAELSVPFISAPTIASTDGAVSSIAVEYSDDHTHIGVMRFNCSPAVVLVDTQVVANAPVRLLVAGMGDSLSTWFEARACHAKGINNFRGGAISDIAMNLARSCHETIMHYGRDALCAVEKNLVNEAVERVVEANVFLSGVGFENTGVAGAHALDTAVSRYSSDHSIYHGERVALGVLFQLKLEGDTDAIRKLLPFFKDVGLPINLQGIGLKDMSAEDLKDLATIVMRDGSPIRNLPFHVKHDDVVHALSQLL